MPKYNDWNLTADVLVKVTTPPCPACKKDSEVKVPNSVLLGMQKGEAIQHAWPTSTPNERELFMTGMHVKCKTKVSKEKN